MPTRRISSRTHLTDISNAEGKVRTFEEQLPAKAERAAAERTSHAELPRMPAAAQWADRFNAVEESRGSIWDQKATSFKWPKPQWT